MNEPTLRVLSLGAGVQSTTMALMAAHGEFGVMPDCAIFADTMSEPDSVYRHLNWLREELSYPVHIVSNGCLRQDTLDYRDGKKNTGAMMPFYVRLPDGTAPPMNRSCTRDYKIKPITQKAKQLLGFKKGQRIPEGTTVDMWIGISTDEIQRMKPSREKWIEHRWPLVDKRMTRGDCIAWMVAHGYQQPPRSACWFCPFSSNERWRHLKDNEPEEWARAINFDDELRVNGNWRGARGPVFLHKSALPLKDADLGDTDTIDMFNNECEGVCGV